MELNTKYNPVLGKAAFMAMRHGMLNEAEVIFSGLARAFPEKVGPVLGLAMHLMNKKDYEGAIEKLENEALAIDAADPFARTYLGLALYLNKQHDRSKEVLEAVVAENAETTTQELAKGLLEEMNAPSG